ncbi:MAG: citrate lyase subunit alpha, partial [Candidatus Marinimicrobia bacterium]|nr:citrate lyase subunit alpha [Candidatus Neomarinimicrobiota bacterium]
MANKTEWIKNAVGRWIPTEINGEVIVPFKGIGKYKPSGNRYGPPIRSSLDYPPDGNKQVKSLKEALVRSGIRDGMVISTHHHLRNGDMVANQIFKAASELGVKDLVWFPSASFPCHEPIIEYLENGTIN